MTFEEKEIIIVDHSVPVTNFFKQHNMSCFYFVHPVVYHHRNFLHADTAVGKKWTCACTFRVLQSRHFHEKPSGDSARRTKHIAHRQSVQTLLLRTRRRSTSHCSQTMRSFMLLYIDLGVQSNASRRLLGKMLLLFVIHISAASRPAIIRNHND